VIIVLVLLNIDGRHSGSINAMNLFNVLASAQTVIIAPITGSWTLTVWTIGRTK
jgi:hypothetical protein